MRGRDAGGEGSRRKDTVLFINAKDIFRQVDRAHRKFSPKQVEYIANIVRLYRGEKPEFMAGEDEELPGEEPDLKATFPKLKYVDIAGLLKNWYCREIVLRNFCFVRDPSGLVPLGEQGWYARRGKGPI